MTSLKQDNLKCTVICGLILHLGMAWLPASHAQQPDNAYAHNNLIQAQQQNNAIPGNANANNNLIQAQQQGNAMQGNAMPGNTYANNDLSQAQQQGNAVQDNAMTGNALDNNNSIGAQQQGNATTNNAIVNNKLIQTLSRRNLNFAFNIYRLMADQEDVILSPFSVSVALTMTSFGARNHTLKQMYDALYLNGFEDHMQIAKGYSDILKSLELKGDVTLAISNRIFIDKSYNIKKPFKDIVSNEFRSVAQSVNFLDDGQIMNNEINKYVDEITQNKIKSLGSLEKAEKYMGAVLVSAIYFKGKWAQQFSLESTHPEVFQMANRKTQLGPMMHTQSEFYYAEDDIFDAKIIKLDYSGNRLVLYIILPNTLGSLKAVKENLTAQWFENMMNNMQLKEVIVALPRFNSNCTKDLSPELKNLNLYDFENERTVDLNEIAEPQPSGSRLFVQKVLYAAYVDVGEAGTRAQALAHNHTIPENQKFLGQLDPAQTSSQKEKPKEFYADHPFVFIIHDSLTNFLLFIGNVDNPLQ